MLMDNFNFKYKGRDTVYQARRVNFNMFEITWGGKQKTRYFENIIINAIESGIWILQ